jgi:hypothetical protein
MRELFVCWITSTLLSMFHALVLRKAIKDRDFLWACYFGTVLISLLTVMIVSVVLIITRDFE